MQELPIVIVVFGAIVLIFDHIRRIFGAISLNRTLRDALHHHPASIPLLLEKYETRPRLPLALGGWVFLGLGVLAGVLSVTSNDNFAREGLMPAAIVGGLGVVLLIASWWVGRSANPLTKA